MGAVKHFPRILRNAATAVSLVPCLATLAAWVVGYFAHDAVGFWPSPAERRPPGVRPDPDRGTVCAARLGEGDGHSRWTWRHDPVPRRGDAMFGGTAGFVLRRTTRGGAVARLGRGPFVANPAGGASKHSTLASYHRLVSQ
jgi:hypothetical protein